MDELIRWLLEGDVSIQYLTGKYLLDEPEDRLAILRKRIASEGWGRVYMDERNPSTGHWGRGFYQPKWISSHYTLLDLKYLEIETSDAIRDTIGRIVRDCRQPDGSINEAKAVKPGDICVNGMFLNYAAFFGADEAALTPVVDYLLQSTLPDGGLNCNSITMDVSHSSMHTTIAFLEGMNEFIKSGHTYRRSDILEAVKKAEAFLLMHRLFKSDRTGAVIDRRWTMLSFPSRWRYDILRALVYFADSGASYDQRMDDAMEVLLSKRRKDGSWPLQMKHPGNVHFDMEKVGASSRINTLRALRVLNAYR